MWIKNNSEKEWLGYRCGGSIVDVKAKSTFEVSDRAGKLLIRNLGHKNWLTKIDEPNRKETKQKVREKEEVEKEEKIEKKVVGSRRGKKKERIAVEREKERLAINTK